MRETERGGWRVDSWGVGGGNEIEYAKEYLYVSERERVCERV